MRSIYCLIIGLSIGCQYDTTKESVETNAKPIPKIDIHAHYRADRPYLPSLLDSFNLRPLLVDVARVDTTEWYAARNGLKQVYKKYPQYYYCAAFAANDIDNADYAENVIERLEDEIDQGARMVKVWKNFGMISKDQQGNFVQIDDPRLQPIWDFLISRDIPVLAHIGEPVQAWRPLEDDNPHANYYRNHPEYHAYQHPEIPSWETIQTARNNWLANNPQLIVVGAHNGSMSHDVDLIAVQLDKFPNFFVEPAARFGDLVRQDSKKVRDFMIQYQDRVLYGTDLGTSADIGEMSEQEILEEKKGITHMMHNHWKYLSGSGTLDFSRSLNSKAVPTEALDLPDSVLNKIYYQNAAKILKIN